MVKKLTLTVEYSIIETAKKYAKTKNKSVSKIVEDYFRNIADKNSPANLSDKIESPITDSLTGLFPDNGKDYKTLLDEARMEKFS